MKPTIISKKAGNWVDRGEPAIPTLGRVLAYFFELDPSRDQAWLDEHANIILGMVAADATEVHVVDRWCYLGAARDDAEVSELIAAEPRFDYDHYRILARHLGRPGLRVRQLPA